MEKPPLHIFTTITANYFPKARVLAHSIKELHPSAKIYLVLCDVVPESVVLAEEPFDFIITLEQLKIPNFKSWLFQHNIIELCTAVKGIAFDYIFDKFDCKKLLFFDPDIVILSPLDSLIQKLDYHSVLLTPHQTVPESEREAIIDNEIHSLKVGVFNLGFLGIRNSEQGRKFIAWWRDRCLEFCYDDTPNGLFTDQKWVDLAPAFFSDYLVLQEPIYNVATWNLTHRRVTGSLKEGIYVNGELMCFYHFSGLDSGDQEFMLNKYGKESPVLFQLREWYLKECEHYGQREFSQIPFYYATFENGEVITQEHRLLYRHREDLKALYPNPFLTSDPDYSYYHWFLTYGDNEYIPSRYKCLQSAEQALQSKKEELAASQKEIELLKQRIQAMESSKFWRLRETWLWLKKKFRLT
ncbi:glycosyl transferase [Euhalothece natronophila Z-M001]|uniref:Glycosyl transferase n=1 Tax=Euhalothece natronophila Z-M001 TaxID=522448 RepID=A0A5B8NHH0_9CHRO|nr:glycosyl transferase [Euhalothece natronophila]QDZ38663.1 glycosyl transferase [Euhalothece natronophila Z-M001]